ncbi:MerR family transcriptional regulator [Bosea sp. ASV33]|uniref:MerR family transcriptional regulator n=1 Tax=Bosea sp. ASV33 TaxID=2795106 RepID=UPI0018EAC519|nr:MerR family transcriptional regulator [Bosea sp. ASV33]
MTIGELAKRTGLTNSRIRFYESAGLLQTVDRRPNGYRTYPPEAVLVLELITTAQKAGFSLDEIRKLLPPGLDHWDHAALIAALRRKVADIETLETRLKESKAQLVALIADIEAKPDDMDCVANARRVLSRVLGDRFGSEDMPIGDGGLLAKASRPRRIKA